MQHLFSDLITNNILVGFNVLSTDFHLSKSMIVEEGERWSGVEAKRETT